MSPLLVTLLGLVATTYAIPQGYGQSGNLGIQQTPKPDFNPGKTPNLPAGCSIQYKTVNVIVEVEEFTTKCEQRYRNQCVQKIKTVCNPWQENVCNTLYKEQCETKYKDNCYEAYKDVQEPYTENVCVDQGQRRCTKHWQCADPSQSLPNCNDKVWVENPNDCTVLVETECNDVQNYRTVKQPYRKCDQVSWNDCKDVPYQKCDLITHDGCQDQPWNDCQDVPYEHCEDVHKLVPQQTSQKKPFRVCNDNSKPYEFTEQEIADYDFIESVINAKITEEPQEDSDVEIIDTGIRSGPPEETTSEKAEGAITFG